jgi:2-polyprenyl-6-methoxyphenol hydroxylase-like FAD-dependent oxidoreductase
VTYYSRYYRRLPGCDAPDTPFPFGPRGDLGYFGFSTFPGDNRTFAALFAVPPGPEWRGLKETRAFEAAVAQVPALARWVDPQGVEPITDVLPMAGLRNTLRSYDPTVTRGLAPVGDALSHTDPVLSHGLPFALIHARELTAALRDRDDIDEALGQYAQRTAPLLRERFELATALDAQRLRMWAGEPVDFFRRDGDYELFAFVGGAVASMLHADIFRMHYRRMGLLDSTSVLDNDLAMQQRIQDVFADVRSAPRPPSGPTRDEMFELVTRAS